MKPSECVVYVVDDDARVREALESLLAASGFRVLAFESAEGYLAADPPEAPACLIVDVELPGSSGLDLQRQLAAGSHPPIVFITGHGDIPSSVRAMKAGAVDFLPKPFGHEQLLAAVSAALELHGERRAAHAELSALRARHASLTPREREVLPLVVRGLLNKQAAAELGISEVTLQIHRGQIMRKMAADSLAELVRMAVKLGIGVAGPRRHGASSEAAPTTMPPNASRPSPR